VDLATTDTGRSVAFYTGLFGWEADEPAAEFGGYITFRRDGDMTAGCMASQPGQEPANFWSVYLATDDTAKTLEAAAAHGGQVLMPAMQVGDLGVMGMAADAGGAVIGLWQPGLHRGFAVYGEDGSPGWFELMTKDYQHAAPFYRDVFGWETKVMADTPDFRYTVLQPGEEMLAGIMDASGFLPEGVPSNWSVYFATGDTDASVAKALSLGATVVQAAEDTPYGRLAGLTDPNGAYFKLVGPNDQMPASSSPS
jgi:predicted enzyme related to lactoylglutathione lyase